MSLNPTNLPIYGHHHGGACFSDTVLGADGCVYGIPFCSWRFVKLDPTDDTMAEFGPNLVTDLGFGSAQVRYGVLANDGFIYVIQFGSEFMLRVDTNEGESNGLVEAFEVEFPAGYDGLPRPDCSGALGPDGFLYFPFSNHKMMRFHPTSRRLTNPFPWKSPLGLAGRMNISRGRLVVLPQPPRAFYPDVDPEVTYNTDLQTFTGSAHRLTNLQTSWKSHEGGVFGRDGHLYFLNYFRQIVRLDPWTGAYTYQDTPCRYAENPTDRINEFGTPCLGSDGCIYWPPKHQDRILKYDPHNNAVGFVGMYTRSGHYWSSGVTAPNGKTYFFPYIGSATQVLVVDPLGEYKTEFFERIAGNPFKFGLIFERKDSNGRSNGNTAFGEGVEKFGMDTMLQMLDECILQNQETFDRSKVPVSLLAALCDECPLEVIYHFTRENIGNMKSHLESAIADSAPQEEAKLVNLVLESMQTLWLR